jgi:hypothetical protein
MTSARSALAIVAAGLVLSGCGFRVASTARSSTKFETPTQVALAWFSAINSNDVRAAHRLFEPSQVDLIAWMNEPAADQSKFTDIHCRMTSLTANSAAVLCTFVESASPTEGNPDTFWSVYVHRSPSNGWLIDNYGQA